MEITLILDLQDHTESSCQKRLLELSSETTIKQLRRKIKHFFSIDEEYQMLYFKGDQILSLDSTLQRIGLKNEDTIVVKHVLLSKFATFEELLNTGTNDSNDKQDIAKKVRTLKETLDSSKFFEVYDRLYTGTREQYTELMRCLNNDHTVIMESVRHFLGANHVKYLPGMKPGGSNAGFMFDFTCDGTTENYYLKTNETNWGANPDARELIVYLLLQHIGVGPSKCYFIPNVAQSKSVVYIATLKVPGFTMAKDLPNPLDEAMAVELHLLAIILHLTDLNTENYGLDSHGSLAIVDFSLTKNYKEALCVRHFKEHVRRQPCLDNLNNCPASRRVKIGKEAMKRWDFDTIIKAAEDDFLKIKENLNDEVAFLDRASGAIKDYLEAVKWNIQTLISEWDNDSS